MAVGDVLAPLPTEPRLCLSAGHSRACPSRCSKPPWPRDGHAATADRASDQGVERFAAIGPGAVLFGEWGPDASWPRLGQCRSRLEGIYGPLSEAMVHGFTVGSTVSTMPPRWPSCGDWPAGERFVGLGLGIGRRRSHRHCRPNDRRALATDHRRGWRALGGRRRDDRWRAAAPDRGVFHLRRRAVVTARSYLRRTNRRNSSASAKGHLSRKCDV